MSWDCAPARRLASRRIKNRRHPGRPCRRCASRPPVPPEPHLPYSLSPHALAACQRSKHNQKWRCWKQQGGRHQTNCDNYPGCLMGRFHGSWLAGDMGEFHAGITPSGRSCLAAAAAEYAALFICAQFATSLRLTLAEKYQKFYPKQLKTYPYFYPGNGRYCRGGHDDVKALR